MAIEGSWVLTPQVHTDPRGAFLEWFTASSFRAATGHALGVAQANCSISQAGVLRGIHFAHVPPGQAKYVTCIAGAALDVVVDLRLGSPTFGQTASVALGDDTRRAVYLSEGLGHAFLALADQTAIVYLCSAPYAPGREFGISPLDPELGIQWPSQDAKGEPLDLILSEKDQQAPSLAEAERTGILPSWKECRRYRRALETPA